MSEQSSHSTSSHDQAHFGVTAQEMREAIDSAIRRATAPLMARMDLIEREMASPKRRRSVQKPLDSQPPSEH